MEGDETLDFGEEHLPVKLFKNPMVVLLHLFFRCSAIIVYIFCGIFGGGFIGSFVFIVLLLSVDFWVVKNITGRILVGLRWWNYVDDSGLSHWVFEARKSGAHSKVSAADSRIFWIALIVTPIIWILLAFVIIFTWSFRWLMIILVALSLSGSNLYGYLRCKMGNTDSGLTGSVRNFASGLLQRQMMSNLFSRAPPSTSPSNLV